MENATYCLLCRNEQPEKGYHALVYNEADQLIQTLTDTLTNLSPQIASLSITYLASTQDVFLTTTQVPSGASQEKLTAALPFALEESLASNPENLHFTILHQTPIYDSEQIDVDVAVIDKGLFAAQLEQLRENDIYPAAVVPDVLALAWHEGEMVVYLTADLCWIRTAYCMGYCVPTHQAACLLTALQADIPVHFDCIKCYHPAEISSSDYLPILMNIFQDYSDNIETKIISCLSEVLVYPNQNLNLLQGAFRPKRRTAVINQFWYASAACLVLTLIIAFGSAGYRFIYLQHESKRLGDIALELYQKVLPEATELNSPKVVIEEALQKYQTGSVHGDFLLFLGELGSEIKKLPQAELQSLSYDSDALTVGVILNDFRALDTLTENLQARGFNIEKGQTNAQKDRVTATLTLSGGPS